MITSASTVDEVCKWLEEAGFAQYCAAFREQRVDGYALLLLTADGLKNKCPATHFAGA
jgi:hypothetical protein